MAAITRTLMVRRWRRDLVEAIDAALKNAWREPIEFHFAKPALVRVAPRPAPHPSTGRWNVRRPS